MKGKTGKSKMRGGGIARKGFGAAMKGGGVARKGMGAAMKNGGKAKKMADGGTSEKLRRKIWDNFMVGLEDATPITDAEREVFRRKHGNPDDNELVDLLLEKNSSKKKRDTSLLNSYGSDAMKARSFMSEERPPTRRHYMFSKPTSATKKASGGKVKGKK
jgi:hypothetical protein